MQDGADAVAKPGEAIVRIARAPIVPRDLVRAREAGLPITPGREFVGIVQSGPGEWLNKRVVGGASIACGECDLCRAGLSTHCREKGELGITRDGSLAERLCVPVAGLREIPKALDDDRATFAAPLGRALHAAQSVRIEGKPFVTIIGDGATGLLAAQIMTQRNASVRVLGRDPARFGLCEKWGVKHRHIDEVGRRGDQDLVFVCSDAPGDLEIALRLARPRATVLVLSSAPGDAEAKAVLALVHQAEITLVGSRGERLSEAVRLLATDAVDVQSLLTGKFRVGQLAEALARASGPGCIRVLMDFS